MTRPKSRRRAVERILGDESLTADLTDDAARLLLDWGLARAVAVVQQAEGLSQEELDAHITALRRAMRQVNKQAGEATPETQVKRVQDLLAEIELEQDTETETESGKSPRMETDVEYNLEIENSDA